MKRIVQSYPSPQVCPRPVGEIIRELAHPLPLAAARLEWLAHDQERDADDAEIFGNPANVPFERLRAAALLVAAAELRSAWRCGFEPEGIGYGQAVALLCNLAEQEEAHAAPALAGLPPLPETRGFDKAAGRSALAAMLRYSADVLTRECAPNMRELVS